MQKKTIAWEHINYNTGGFIYFKLLRKRYSRLYGIVCLTKDSAEHYKLLNKHTFLIPNIIGDNFENNRQEIAAKENIILLAGRLDPEKNVRGFLNILKSTKLPPSWKVLIAGSGWQESELLQRREELNLGNVQFLGAVPLEEMLLLYAKSKIFCMTSLVEGLPTVLIEAMFFGNALIAYDCPTGPSEIINENNGYLIPMNDEKLFKEKLEILVNDEGKLQNLMISSKNESEKWRKSEIIEKWKKILR